MGALRFDGINDVVSIPSGMTGNVGTSAYSFRIKSGAAGITLPASGIAGIIGSSAASTSSGLVVLPSGALRVYSAGTNRYGSASQLIFNGVPFDYTLTHNADGTWSIFNNLTSSPTGESGTFTASTNFAALNQFGRSSNSNAVYLQGDIDTIEVSGLANAQSWQADLSGGSGSTLPTASGANQGSLVNFPTDNSQWVSFAPAFTQLQAVGQAIAAGVATLTTAIILAAAGASVATCTANLTTSIPLQANGSAVASGTANLTAGSTGLSANGQAVAFGSAQLTTQVRLQAAGAAVASGTAGLATQIRLQASGAAVASGTANLQAGTTSLAAAGQAVASGYAQLTTSIRLSAAATATPAAGANLATGIRLQANGSAAPGGLAILTTEIWLTAAGEANPSGTGVLGDVGTDYLPAPDRLTYVAKENRITAVWGEQRFKAVDRERRILAVRGNA